MRLREGERRSDGALLHHPRRRLRRTRSGGVGCRDPPPTHRALIDTGALITGLSNKQVAESLLRYGLDWCDGVVFLDEQDRKVILVRATWRVLKLAQCGIPKHRRFAFYDQIHTTGMDIQHKLDAVAVLTLGKDMVFRDYAQGAFRMRGIGKGQTIRLLLTPEVEELMTRELKAAGDEQRAETGEKRLLQDITAWLVINSMRSERVQYNQLCIQNVHNVWRKNGFKHVLERFSTLRGVQDGPVPEEGRTCPRGETRVSSQTLRGAY